MIAGGKFCHMEEGGAFARTARSRGRGQQMGQLAEEGHHVNDRWENDEGG